MARDIKAHQDSYLNLSKEIIAARSSTIFYDWRSITPTNNIYPALDGVYTLKGGERNDPGQVLSIDEATTNLIESNNINSRFSDMTGWAVTRLTTQGISFIMRTDGPTNSSIYALRLHSGQNMADIVHVATDLKPFMASSTTYTLSFYYRTITDNLSGEVNVIINNTGPISVLNTNLSLSEKWERATLTFTTPGGMTSQYIQIGIDFDGYADITSVQLEARDFATAWYWYDRYAEPYDPTYYPRADGYMKLADNDTYPAFFPDSQLAVSTWVKYNHYTGGEAQTMVGCATSGWRLGKTTAGEIEFSVMMVGESVARASFNQSLLAINEWHMVSGIYSDSKIHIHLDGQLKNLAAAPGLILYKDDVPNSIPSKEVYAGMDSSLVVSRDVLNGALRNTRIEPEININPQVIQTWYENDMIYDWRYKKVIA